MTTITQTLTTLPTAPSRADPTNFSARGDALMTALPVMVTEINTLKDQMNTVAGEVNANATTASTGATTATTQAGVATTKAAEAAASAASAVNAPGTSSTSTTSVALTAGTKTFTTQTGKTYPVGASVKFARTSDVTKWAVGTVVSYDNGTGELVLSVDANDINGTGTFSDWTLSISGHRGVPGAAAVAPGMVLISTATASNVATVDFTSGIDSTYDTYMVTISNVVPATGTARLLLRTSSNGGASFDATAGDYAYSTSGFDGASGSSMNGGTSSDTSIYLVPSSSYSQVSSTSADGGVCLSLFVHRPSVAAKCHVNWQGDYAGGSGVHCISGAGRRNAAVAVNAIRFLFTSYNIASGEFKLYGLKKS